MSSLSTKFAFRKPGRPMALKRPVTVMRQVEPLGPRVDIPVRDPSPDWEETQTFLARGQHLARQDAWEELGPEICEADKTHSMTCGLTSIAALLSQGARSDAVSAARAAANKAEAHTARAILATLEMNLEDAPDCPAIAYTVAMANIEVAHAWAGASSPKQLSPQRREAFEWHMQTAAAFADQFDPFETQSALWAMVRCQVLNIDPRPGQRIADDYEDLIDLDPSNPDNLRAFGRDMLPSRFGNREMLDREARRTTMRTSDVWGMGAYSWIMIGAIEKDATALRWIDPELFAEGLHDILARHPGQHMVNRLAAFCGLSASSTSIPGTSEARISNCFNWIAQDHLYEIHPAVWANAPTPGLEERADESDRDALIKRGRTRAVSAIAEHFAPLLNNGRRLVFSPNGLKMPRMT